MSVAYVESFDIAGLTVAIATVSKANDAEQDRREAAERARKAEQERRDGEEKRNDSRSHQSQNTSTDESNSSNKPKPKPKPKTSGGKAIAWLSKYGQVQVGKKCASYCGYTWPAAGGSRFIVSEAVRDDSPMAWHIVQHEAAHAILDAKQRQEWQGPRPNQRVKPGKNSCWANIVENPRMETITDAAANIRFGTPLGLVYAKPTARDWAIAKLCLS